MVTRWGVAKSHNQQKGVQCLGTMNWQHLLLHEARQNVAGLCSVLERSRWLEPHALVALKWWSTCILGVLYMYILARQKLQAVKLKVVKSLFVFSPCGISKLIRLLKTQLFLPSIMLLVSQRNMSAVPLVVLAGLNTSWQAGCAFWLAENFFQWDWRRSVKCWASGRFSDGDSAAGPGGHQEPAEGRPGGSGQDGTGHFFYLGHVRKSLESIDLTVR
jgi:hypothetical protein